VSTILRSLKRLEKEKESIVPEKMAMLPVYRARQAMHQAVKSAWFKSRFIQLGLLAVALIAGAAALYAYNRPSAKPLKIAPPAARTDRISAAAQGGRPAATLPHAPAAQPVLPKNTPSDTAPKTALASGNIADALALKPAPSAIGRMPLVSHDPAGAHDHSLETAAASPVQRPGAAGSSDQPVAANPAPSENAGVAPSADPPTKGVALEPARSASAAGAAGPSHQEQRYANAERMTDGRLKVQAIVWAANTDDRMAVINSRIVREGAVIDGCSLVRIGEDAVYVNEGGRLLKVPFGKP